MPEWIIQTVAWIVENKEWLFSGIGCLVVTGVVSFAVKKRKDLKSAQKLVADNDAIGVQVTDIDGNVNVFINKEKKSTPSYIKRASLDDIIRKAYPAWSGHTRCWT